MTPEEILQEAKRTREKDSLAVHEKAIRTLREKKYSWRDIAKFLCDRGVETDHSKVFRFVQKIGRLKMDARPEFVVPTAEKYVQALKEINMSDIQRKMLAFHFHAHNRTATFTELAKAAGYDTHSVANLHYGGLGNVLGNYLGIAFDTLDDDDPESQYRSSAIGTAKKYDKKEWTLIMHHELAKAVETLGWFKK